MSLIFYQIKFRMTLKRIKDTTVISIMIFVNIAQLVLSSAIFQKGDFLKRFGGNGGILL